MKGKNKKKNKSDFYIMILRKLILQYVAEKIGGYQQGANSHYRIHFLDSLFIY